MGAALAQAPVLAVLYRLLLLLLPYGTVAVAALAPVGVGLHLVSTTAWTVAERAVLPRLLA